MEEYILSITSVALFCGICNGMLPITGKLKELIRFICGIVMLFSFIMPFKDLDLNNAISEFEMLYEQADSYIGMGEETSRKQKAEIIKQKTEAYILDKALSFNANIQVEAVMSQDDPPLPVSVTMRGTVSPYTRQILTRQIAQELGIPEEEQIWMS